MGMSKSGLLLNIFAAALLSACSENIDFQGYSPEQYNAAYPKNNKVELRHMLIDLEFKGTAKSLSPKDIIDLQNLLGSVNPHAVDYIMLKTSDKILYKTMRVHNVKNLLLKSGYNSPIHVVTIKGIPDNKLIIDVAHTAVVSPDCPDWRKSPITTFSNTTHTNFGCSATTNLGLMIDNPRDLVRGRDLNSRNHSERADKALSDYRSGTGATANTATASTASASGGN